MSKKNGTANGSRSGAKVQVSKGVSRETTCSGCGGVEDRVEMIFAHSHGILCRLCFSRIVRPGEPRLPVSGGGPR